MVILYSILEMNILRMFIKVQIMAIKQKNQIIICMMVCYIILEIFVYLGMKESMSSKKHIHLSFHDKLGKIVEQLHIYCYWPRMNETISKYIKGCVLCSTSKLSNKNLGLYMALPIPSQSWEIVTMDFVGGLLLHSKMPPSHWKKS